MSKHTLKPWVWEWKKEDDTGWRHGRLIARDILNGQYNKTIIIVEHYNHNDESQANIDLLETAPETAAERDELFNANAGLRIALLDIINECPNPKLPYGTNVVEIARAALAERESGETNQKGDTKCQQT